MIKNSSYADEEFTLGKLYFFLCRKKGDCGDHILPEGKMWIIHHMYLPSGKCHIWIEVSVVVSS